PSHEAGGLDCPFWNVGTHCCLRNLEIKGKQEHTGLPVGQQLDALVECLPFDYGDTSKRHYLSFDSRSGLRRWYALSAILLWLAARHGDPEHHCCSFVPQT